MTPQTVLNRSVFGQGWRPITSGVQTSRKSFRPPRDRQTLDPETLQEVIDLVPIEASRELRQTTPQLSALSFNQELRWSTQTRGEASAPIQQAEPVLGASATQILGENGIRRFQEFVGYASGWDLGEGATLSLRSVALINAFLKRLPELAAFRPSLFLTHEGNLQIGWEDNEGRAIEIEFHPESVEYYLEASNEERTIRLEAVPRFIERVRSLVS